jgi:hypothetical protein
MYLGLTNKVLSFGEVFGVRKRETQIKMDQKKKPQRMGLFYKEASSVNCEQYKD